MHFKLSFISQNSNFLTSIFFLFLSPLRDRFRVGASSAGSVDVNATSLSLLSLASSYAEINSGQSRLSSGSQVLSSLQEIV